MLHASIKKDYRNYIMALLFYSFFSNYSSNHNCMIWFFFLFGFLLIEIPKILFSSLYRKEELKLKWDEKTKENFAKGANEKQQVAQAKERKRLDLLESLQECGGPFTNADQVEQYLRKEDIVEKEKFNHL